MTLRSTSGAHAVAKQVGPSPVSAMQLEIASLWHVVLLESVEAALAFCRASRGIAVASTLPMLRSKISFDMAKDPMVTR